MIQHPSFEVDPWVVRETALDLDTLAQTESVFALANGHLGLRANLDEGAPFGVRGSYLAGFYERRPLPYAEPGYGDPEVGQSIVNVADGKVIRLLVQDEPFDVRYGELIGHERVLDLRAGVLRRSARWRSPSGRLVQVRSTRLVSFSQRAVAAVFYEVEPLEEEVSVVVQSELVADEPPPERERDPRGPAALDGPLRPEFHGGSAAKAVLVHSTVASGLRVGAAMDHVLGGPEGTESSLETFEQVARLSITTELSPGRPLRVLKFLAYGWSGKRSVPAIRDQVEAALTGACHTGWEGLLAEQRAHLDDFWARADIEIDGDPEIQQAVRFGLFHVLQAGARGEQRAIPAKGLTGPGYDGHTFWDTEMFVLPVLTYTAPRAAADALRWRHRTLDLARERARLLGLDGAAFPWRTIGGEECSGYWPAGVAAFHINADIADAVERYRAASGDVQFERDTGLPLLVESARLWRSLGFMDHGGRFRIDGVTGPDEYSAIADNNVYTNLMAQRNLRAAADAAERHPDGSAELGVDPAEISGWREAADSMSVPFDAALGVHPQSEGFTGHEVWEFGSTRAEQFPLMLHFPYFDLYRKQVVKQADLVLALHWRGDAFSLEEKERDFAYYESLTVRDSSLSACTQCVLAAETGHLGLAYDYLRESALLDMDDLEHNTRDGLHIASLAGSWLALVAGFGGMRDHDGRLTFTPRLPSQLTRLAFRLSLDQRTLLVEVRSREATYSIDGPPLGISHHGQELTVVPGQASTLPIPRLAERDPPRQPPGREPGPQKPVRRRAAGRRPG